MKMLGKKLQLQKVDEDKWEKFTRIFNVLITEDHSQGKKYTLVRRYFESIDTNTEAGLIAADAGFRTGRLFRGGVSYQGC